MRKNHLHIFKIYAYMSRLLDFFSWNYFFLGSFLAYLTVISLWKQLIQFKKILINFKNHHLQCLTDFVDAQLNYYNSCSKILQDLSKQIGGSGLANNSNNIGRIAPPLNNLNNAGLPPNFTSMKKAKVLFDYEATDPSEISVSANQVRT